MGNGLGVWVARPLESRGVKKRRESIFDNIFRPVGGRYLKGKGEHKVTEVAR